MVSDGDNNNMIMLAITKVKTTDEGEYRVVVENEHGKDEKSFMLYVSGKHLQIKKMNSMSGNWFIFIDWWGDQRSNMSPFLETRDQIGYNKIFCWVVFYTDCQHDPEI